MADLTDRELQSLRNLGNESEALADEVESLRAERSALQHDHRIEVDQLRSERDAARSKVAALEADAKRYRWLRLQNCGPDDLFVTCICIAQWTDGEGQNIMRDEADAAIDAAMGADRG